MLDILEKINISFDSRLKAKEIIEALFDAITEAEIEKSYSLIAALEKLLGREYTMDVLLSSVKSNSMFLQALLSAANITLEHFFNALLSERVTKPYRIDVVVGAATFAFMYFDTLLSHQASKLFHLGAITSITRTRNYPFNSLFTEMHKRNLEFDSLVSQTSQSHLQFASALLKIGLVKQLLLDTILERKYSTNFLFDSHLCPEIPSRSYVLETILRGINSTSLSFTTCIFKRGFIDTIDTSMSPIMVVSAGSSGVC